MQTDPIQKTLETIAASRALRARQLANRAELQRKASASAKPLYVLKSKRQMELRLQ